MTCPACQAENDPGAPVCFECGAALAAVTRGSLLASRYEVRERLGRGGMGTVYQAHDRVLDEDVALKVLRADLGRPGEAAGRFRSEIKLARTVSHWNVCRIHEYGEDQGLSYLSMELVRGETFREVLARRGPLPADEALDLALQAAEGLAAIHRAGIVHRDLSAVNLTLDATGRVRVMDFGIARRVAGGTAPTAEGYVVGNPEYMSPEQARGRPVDFRSDVYALGIVLFELLTGRVPFRGESPVATLLLHAEAPPPLDQPGLPAAVVPVLRRALAKAPAERLASAAELATALRDARQALAAGGARRRSVLPIAVGAGGVVVIVTLAVLWGRSTGAPSAVPSRPPAAAAGRASPPVVSQRPAPTTVASAPAVPEPTSTASRLRPRTTVQPAPPPSPEPSPATSEPQATPAPATEPPPTTRPAAVPSATAQPPVSTVAAAEGFLLVLVRPWADVHVDGRFAGQTPLARIPLPPGAHDVRLVHPEFQPFARRVTIREGETYRLRVDLPTEGVRRSR